MEKINDDKLIDHLYEKYDIGRLFAVDFKSDLFLVKFEKGEIIQQEGDAVSYLYFMVGGIVKVSIAQENGKSKLICFLNDFEVLGDIELFAESNCVSQLEAIKETYCLALNLNKYRKILLEDDVFNKHMAKVLAKIVLSNNLSTSFNLLYRLENRVATYILLTAKEECFQDNLTSVAELLATSYRHLHRVLSNLCTKKILEKDGRCYKIIDKNRLREMSNESITHF
ncbi:MAG TPA: cyclic nucleotide-binding domain-containing protein [Thermotogota bacterium]|nr:cyclic nucleotide-binding domain-containing protein [Thermotogota bacterium]HPJ90039.1 cyclic nucleotide-binding domain-containing protein [Thermotogota bacterium]HPR95978.1 cyclic nucleotide-binding domain-containing protein [Thermotogota bacterium]